MSPSVPYLTHHRIFKRKIQVLLYELCKRSLLIRVAACWHKRVEGRTSRLASYNSFSYYNLR